MIILRTEIKYMLDLRTYKSFRKALIPFTQKDPFTPEHSVDYNVHSIYYDTFSFKNYEQKLEGEEEREKFRVRFYDYNQDPNYKIWVELKQKRGPVIKKLRYPIELNKFNPANFHGPQDPSEFKIMQSFHRQNLMPMVNISYKREALVCPFGSDLRITFDKEIMGSYAPQFSTQAPEREVRLINPLYMILEIKTADSLPTWLTRLIKKFDLESCSFSKYGKGIENCSIIERQRGI